MSDKGKFLAAIIALAAVYGIVINTDMIAEAVGLGDKWDGNPLNIRGTFADSTKWEGEKESPRNAKNYMGFVHPKFSFRAGFILLRNYRKNYNIISLEDIIHRYAPPSDNNHTINYIDYIADKLGISPVDEVTENIYPQMLAYMSDFETGEHGKYSPNTVRGYLNELKII